LLFAGKDGRCYPSHETLAKELCLKPRQVRNLLGRLRAKGWLQWRRTGKSNAYAICAMKARPIADQTGSGVPNGSAVDCLQKEVLKDQGKENTDLDWSPTHRTNRDAPPTTHSVPSQMKQYPSLKEVLHRYFREEGQDDLYPTDRTVVDVMKAARGATEEEVIACLRYLYEERGLKPGTRNGPRHWSWFPVTVADNIERWRQWEEAASPDGYHEWEARNEYRLSKTEFDGMTEAIEI
jgi:hypothetical protein